MQKEDQKEKIIKIGKKNRVDLDAKVHDNPFLRHEATTSDLLAPVSSDQPSNFRLAAVKYTDKMLTSETRRNYWVQLGPTAIPFGQAESYSRILVTGRVTAIVVD